MDLYEALKAGTSEAELVETFKKDLEDARNRIQEEMPSAKDEEILNAARENLISSIIDYAEAITGEDYSDFEEDLESTLKSFEENLDCFKIIEDSLGSLGLKIKASSVIDDDSILRAFIASL